MANDFDNGFASAEQLKCCSKCGECKPLSDFNRKATTRDGRRASCRICQGIDNRAYAKANPLKIYDKTKRYRAENPDKLKKWAKTRSGSIKSKEQSAAWHRKNKTKRTAMGRAWRALNPHKRSEYNAKYSSTPKGKLCAAVRVSVRSEIRFGSKGGRKTFDLLGYSPAELMEHLERLFSPGMTWNNYGRGGWHVDHKIPLSLFNFETPDHQDFKRAWALSNLQPMWEPDNISKGNRIDFQFQPSLMI